MLTANEIKKALECCGAHNCVSCPYFNNNEYRCTNNELIKDTLEYINNLEAEVERLQRVNNSLDVIGKFYSELKADATKECIEELKKRYSIRYTTSLWKVLCEDLDNLYKELMNKSAE